MTADELRYLIDRSLFADLGYIDADGRPAVRRVFCTWHKGLGTHLISTNTSSSHVQAIMQEPCACLYFADSGTFEGIALTGTAAVRTEPEYKRLLWHDGDEKYYPKGIDDEDYCVIEFKAEKARFYRFDGKGDLSREQIGAFDSDKLMEDRYAAVTPQKDAGSD